MFYCPGWPWISGNHICLLWPLLQAFCQAVFSPTSPVFLRQGPARGYKSSTWLRVPWVHERVVMPINQWWMESRVDGWGWVGHVVRQSAAGPLSVPPGGREHKYCREWGRKVNLHSSALWFTSLRQTINCNGFFSVSVNTERRRLKNKLVKWL